MDPAREWHDPVLRDLRHALSGDPDEDPTGDAGMPICGNCARERDFFVMDIADGVEDGRLDLGRLNSPMMKPASR